MTCPYRYYNSFGIESWMCKLAFQKCPEGHLDGFQFKECSTYREHEEILNE